MQYWHEPRQTERSNRREGGREPAGQAPFGAEPLTPAAAGRAGSWQLPAERLAGPCPLLTRTNSLQVTPLPRTTASSVCLVGKEGCERQGCEGPGLKVGQLCGAIPAPAVRATGWISGCDRVTASPSGLIRPPYPPSGIYPKGTSLYIFSNSKPAWEDPSLRQY